MIVGVSGCMCVAVPEPREWKMDDRSGISYKVELSDGNSTIQFPVLEEVYPLFEPFERYDVDINIEQTDFDGRKGVRARVVNAIPAKKA